MCIYDVYGPCSCPHGRCFTILAQGFAIGSWITSMLALTSCFYVSVRPIPLEGEEEAPKEGFGWISRQVEVMEPPAYGKQCAWYTPEERSLYFDSMWNAGFAMALITVIVGVFVMSTVMCTCCVAFQLPTFDGLFWTCVICFVAQCLTFLSWGSELCDGDVYECTWSSGTGMNLTAAMMWVWAANMIKSFPEALPPRTRGNRRNQGGDDGDDEMGDVYLSNRSGAPSNGESFYQDDDYGDWDNDASNADQGDGYYDEDGNWVANDYDDPNNNYDSYDDYDNNNSQMGDTRNAYSDYDNESDGNWAEESDDNFDENAPMDAPKTKSARKKKNKKADRESGASSSQGSFDDFDNDDWDDERGSFRY